MLDRPHRSLPHCRAVETIAPPTTPEQGPRRARICDNPPRRSLFLENNSCGGGLIIISEPQRRDWRMLTYGAALLAPAVVLLVAWPKLAANLFANGFAEQMFMPHGMCYLWVPQLYLLHVSSDFLIGLSYIAISSTLIYLIYRARHDIPFSWIFVAFGVFIFSCSITHFMEVWTIWNATYWLSGYVKLLTAASSVATAVVLPFLVPKVLMLIKAVKLSEDRRVQLERAHHGVRGSP